MSVNIKSSLDALKRQALNSIVSNIDIKFPNIKQDVLNYSNYGGNEFAPLLDMFTFRSEIISSSQVNATYLLSFLDFFALYTILYANYSIFDNLKSSSKNKYLYIYSLYRDMFSLVKEKELEGTYSNVLYINFMNNNKINIRDSQSQSIEKNNNGILGYKDVLTLPIKNTKVIYPISIISNDNDKSLHYTNNNNSSDTIDYIVKRRQYNKIGVAGRILPAKSSIAYGVLPIVKGTINGYIADEIFIIVNDISYNNDYSIDNIEIISSTNNLQWSDPYLLSPSIEADIKIENNIAIGLKIILYDGFRLAKNDSWKVKIDHINIPDPVMTSKIKFASMEQVSYIKFSDVSIYPLVDKIYSLKDIKYNQYELCNPSYTDELNTIIPINSKINELKIEATQNEPYFSNTNGEFTYDFDFKLQEIKSIINEYNLSGSAVFENLKVKDVNIVKLGLSYFINNENIYVDDIPIQKSFIEHNIIFQNKLDKITIPILNEIDDKIILEYVTPYDISTGNIATFKPRFQIDITTTPVVFNIYTKEEVLINSFAGSGDNYFYNIEIPEYTINNSYVIKYKRKLLSFSDINNELNWIGKNNIVYMYFTDINNQNALAIKNKNSFGSLTSFSGDCTYTIDMKSVDSAYISPMIYECKLKLN